MPCGGIWTPEPGSHWLDHECWVCREKGCELFCDEWDTCLHVRCLGTFLNTEEGKCVLLHGHGIWVPERTAAEGGWPGVEIADDSRGGT